MSFKKVKVIPQNNRTTAGSQLKLKLSTLLTKPISMTIKILGFSRVLKS